MRNTLKIIPVVATESEWRLFIYLIFLNFFTIFLIFFWEFSSLGRVELVPGIEFFFFLYFAFPGSVWIKMKPEWCFSNFLNLFTIFFFEFFGECSCLYWVETAPETKFFFSFIAYPYPVWLEMRLEWLFFFKFNYLNFLTNCFEFFWGMHHLELGKNGTQNEKFVFFSFWIFLQFLLNFFWNAPALVIKKGTLNDFFFFLFQPCLAWNEARMPF